MALADRQEGVVHVRQIYALGYTRSELRVRARRGQLHRKYQGVYAVGRTKLTVRGRWMAAVLACGPGAALSHRDAAALHGLRRIGTGRIDVSAVGRHRIPGIRCHTRRTMQRTIVDGIPVTSVAQTLLDLAETMSSQDFTATLEQAQREDKLDLLAIEAVIAASRGHRGIKPLRTELAALDDEPGWTQSELERRFTTLAADHGLPPPSTNVYVEGELVDAVWRAARLVVEVDSWRFHKTRQAFEADRRRDAKLVTAGWRVLRVTYRRLRDEPWAVAADVAALLRDGAQPSAARLRDGAQPSAARLRAGAQPSPERLSPPAAPSASTG